MRNGDGSGAVVTDVGRNPKGGNNVGGSNRPGQGVDVSFRGDVAYTAPSRRQGRTHFVVENNVVGMSCSPAEDTPKTARPEVRFSTPVQPARLAGAADPSCESTNHGCNWL